MSGGTGAGPRIAVVGAGLGGALVACYLGRAGHAVEAFEARPDPRRAGFSGGRSINLALSTRGIRALAGVRLAERVLDRSVPMRGRMIHSPAGRLSFQPYGTEPDQVIRSVSRADLNLALLEAAETWPSVRLRFGLRCVGVDLAAPAVELESGDGERRRVEAELVIGADGAYSAVRAQLQRLDRFDCSQEYLSHGYKELSIPAGEAGVHRMEREALHIWPRGGFMLIALPNLDGSYTCTLFLPFEGANSFQALEGEGPRAFFARHFPDALALMPEIETEYRANPIGSMVTVRCAPWIVADRVVLLGDAAHAVVPFYGQGMNASFEDCAALADALARNGSDRGSALAEYYRARKRNADALADLAVRNFLEMRDRVASPLFLAAKGVGRALHRLAPRLFVPLYTMVTFTSIPYADAVARAERQRRWTIALGLALLALAILVVAA